jgi:hypothetical protein
MKMDGECEPGDLGNLKLMRGEKGKQRKIKRKKKWILKKTSEGKGFLSGSHKSGAGLC